MNNLYGPTEDTTYSTFGLCDLRATGKVQHRRADLEHACVRAG